MKNKILIGAGILLTVLILGLIIVCGASTPSGTPTKETYEIRVDSVQVEIEGEGAKNIPLSILTDNIQFNAEIENKEYTEIKIINKQNYKSKGIVFLAKAESDSNIKFSLYKNDELLKSVDISFKADEPTDVALLLDSSKDILTTDKFFVKVERNEGDETRFVFDSLLSFFDEE